MTTKQVWLAGTSFYDGSIFRAMPSFPVGMPMALEREASNAYDKNAVVVFIDAAALVDAGLKPPTVKPRYKMGHVPAKDGTAAWLAPLMDAGKTARASFLKHGTGPGMQIEIEGEE